MLSFTGTREQRVRDGASTFRQLHRCSSRKIARLLCSRWRSCHPALSDNSRILKKGVAHYFLVKVSRQSKGRMRPIGLWVGNMQTDANNNDTGTTTIAPNASSLAQAASSNVGASVSGNAGIKIANDDLPIHREFIAESRRHLAIAESKIPALKANPKDAEAIDAIFRCFHTIRGVAGFLNLNQVGKLANTAENLMNSVRKQGVLLAFSDIDLILEAIDRMKLLIDALLEAVEHERPLFDLPGLSEFLQRLENCTRECLGRGTRAASSSGTAT
jgi:HPt (histidine-containing phosphotransfer) domain-containing protein